MRMSIVFYSQSGKTAEMAEVIAQGAREVLEEVRCFPLDQIDQAFLKESRVVLFGTPTYYADLCWQIKKWFDESYRIDLAGKLGGAFSTANFVQGGGDVAVLTLLHHMLVKGMLVYSGGAVSKPFVHLGAVATAGNFEESKPIFQTYGRRMAQKAVELFGGVRHGMGTDVSG